MPGIILSTSPRPTAMKRQADHLVNGQTQPGDDAPQAKRARIHEHSIKFRQAGATQSLQGAQDEVFFQSQLLRGISLSLSAQGFDAIESTALESFRLATEAYMLRFLRYVKSSVQSTRREGPTAEDFSFALAKSSLTPSSLSSFLSLPSCQSICQPSIDVPPDILNPEKPSDILLNNLLQDSPQKSEFRQKFVPKHFPMLPSRHTWKSTPIFQTRNDDARKLRERATEEGVMAEQALRRLTEASQVSANRKNEIAKNSIAQGKSARAWEQVLDFVERKDEETASSARRLARQPSAQLFSDSSTAGGSQQQLNGSFEAAAVVNHDRPGWRALSTSKT